MVWRHFLHQTRYNKHFSFQILTKVSPKGKIYMNISLRLYIWRDYNKLNPNQDQKLKRRSCIQKIDKSNFYMMYDKKLFNEEKG